MIFFDSSVLIEAYRPGGLAAARAALAEAVALDAVAINGIVRVEVVAYASHDVAFRRLQRDFDAFHQLELTQEDFGLAAEIGFRLRRAGFTIPATDLIIAASALRAGVELYHLDGHFDTVAQHSPLRARNLRE